ncbi:hypothetical protein TTHERM_00068020 (macronuclear) [Tetrahymena thermophila SB210]|uniref:Transmembrane protein n=1 Tax=Tetrahymena thermophila (strain SB210) TaxID=312017 RepID=I7M0F8_TETTS|nr:hypothetical protein TTHERM_00068020 [Tetrahymena thermophila SB210]EAR87494.2 hypothetical protein TTHERM_00068020 [Tetrahymena thermophila SB210]|eukprot:XP_001007739.2 hypothetical protein TTHERM_00068020 [Tetrahymena thermophila SB210]
MKQIAKNFLLVFVLLLNLAAISQTQSIDVSINLQQNEYKEIDLSEYFGVIQKPFYLYTTQNINGVKLINPLVFQNQKYEEANFQKLDSQVIFQTNCTYSVRIGVKIQQDASQNTVFTIVVDEIQNIQQVITINNLNSFQIANPYSTQMNNIRIQILKTYYRKIFLVIDSNQPTLIYSIDSNMYRYSQVDIDSKLINYQGLQAQLRNQDTYSQGFCFQFGIQKPSIAFSEDTEQQIKLKSYLYNPCGDNYYNIQYIENDAFYLVKCTLQTGNFFFGVAYYLKKNFFDEIQFVKSDQYFANNVQNQQSQIKTITKTVNINLIYVLELYSDTAFNQMKLYKVKFYQDTNSLQVETINFQTDFDLNFDFGVFFIQNDLIAAVTKKYILGFSVLKGSLVYKFELESIPNLSLIDVSQVFSTLLFTYVKDTNPTMYETYQVNLSLPLMTIDMTQIIASPFYFSVREQENPFQQIINFKIQTLSSTQPTTTLTLNQLNIYQVIQQSKGNLQNLNLEKYIFGSNLELNVNQQSTNDIQIKYEMIKPAQLISKVQLETKDLLNLSSTYIKDIYIGVYQANDEQKSYNIKLLKLSADSDNINSFKIIDEVSTNKGNIQQDINGIICITVKQLVQVFLPISYNENYILGSIIYQDSSNFQSFSSDPINKYIFMSYELYVMVFAYLPEKINSQSRYMNYVQSKINGQSKSFQSIQYNPYNNILYFTDNKIIYSYNYFNQYQSQQIQIPYGSKQELNRNVILLFSCFVVFRQYSDNTQEISIYSYNDQISFSNIAIDPQYLRSLNGLGYTLQISNFLMIRKSANIFNMQEYIAIPATSSNNDKVYLIFRMNQVNSQNQLYCAIPADPNFFNIFLFGNELIGFINTQTDAPSLSFYKFSYFIQISMNYQIQDQNFNSDIFFSTSAQIQVVNSQNNLRILDSDSLQMNMNLNLQKDLTSQQGYINKQSNGVLSLLNYFDSQNLKFNDLYYFNDNNVYSGNFLGWQIAYSLPQLNLQIYLQNSLIGKYTNGMNAYDTILFGEIIVLTYQNKLIFKNVFSLNLGENLDYCYLQTDESSIQVTLDPITNKNKIVQTFFTLCQNNQNSSTQQFNRITVLQQPQMYSQDPEIQIIANQSWISTSIQFDKNTQILNKIFNDPNLGLIASIQQLQTIGQSMCQINLSEQEQGPFSFDCSVYETMSALNIVYTMWSNQCESNIFFTQEGLAYYQISKTLDKFQVINIKNILYSQNQNVNYTNQVIKAYSISKIDSTKVILGFNNFSIFEVNIIFNKDKIFEKLTSTQYFTEPNYIFAGFASQSSDQGQTILAMYSLQEEQSITFFYYQTTQQLYTVKNSFKYQLVDPLSLNGQMKIFFVKQNCYFFMNIKNDKVGSIVEISYTGKSQIITRSFNTTNSFDQIGFYLTPLGVNSNQKTTLPVQVKTSQVTNLSQQKIEFFLSLILIGSIIL